MQEFPDKNLVLCIKFSLTELFVDKSTLTELIYYYFSLITLKESYLS